jgi:hypothetical protein
MIKRLFLCALVCALSAAFLFTIGHRQFNIAYAYNPCTDDGGQQFSAPTVESGPYYNGHGSYYVEANGHDCIGNMVNCGSYGCEYFDVYTNGFLSNGGGVLYTKAYGQGQEDCNNSGWITKASAGNYWASASSTDSGIFSFQSQNCTIEHGYRLMSQHASEMYSGQIASETGCVIPSYGWAKC